MSEPAKFELSKETQNKIGWYIVGFAFVISLISSLLSTAITLVITACGGNLK